MDLPTLYETHFDFVWRSLRRLGVPNADVADAIQEVFLTVHRKLGEFEGRCKVSTWLFQIAYGVARTRRRKAHVRREVLDGTEFDELAEASGSPEDALSHQRDIELLDRVLDSMSLEQRAVFMLFEIEELSCEQIAQLLEIPLGTVYSRLRLGRTAFYRALRQITNAQTWHNPRVAAGRSV
jgi:RNA polymerase sigma-70 factor (ECF subfamily)